MNQTSEQINLGGLFAIYVIDDFALFDLALMGSELLPFKDTTPNDYAPIGFFYLKADGDAVSIRWDDDAEDFVVATATGQCFTASDVLQGKAADWVEKLYQIRFRCGCHE